MKAGVSCPENENFQVLGEHRKNVGGSHMNVLVVDIGGTHVKVFATGQAQRLEFPSGPTMTPKQMVSGVKRVVTDWKYDAVSIGYPGPVLQSRPVAEPYHLGK